MDRKKSLVASFLGLLADQDNSKIRSWLSHLSTDQGYNWILVLLRLHKSYDLKTADWDTLLEIYNDEISILSDEIENFRSSKTYNDNTHLINKNINNRQIKLDIEDYYLYLRKPILASFRNDDKLKEELLEIGNKPKSVNQFIALLKSIKRYYENRSTEIEAFQQISTLSNSLISELLREIHSSLPQKKPRSNRTRGYQKGTPTKEQTYAEIEKCLADSTFYKNKKPVVYRISQTVHYSLDKKFKNGELPGVKRMVDEETMKTRIKNYLEEHG